MSLTDPTRTAKTTHDVRDGESDSALDDTAFADDVAFPGPMEAWPR